MKPCSIGLFATVNSALPASGTDIDNRPARATTHADSARKSATGVSPVPTSPSRSELSEKELFNRVYVLPSNICGWYDDAYSYPVSCADPTATCTNIGNYRNCCNGAITDCATYFTTECIPSASLVSSETTELCGPEDTLCCTEDLEPECGTMLFSFSTESYSKTYTYLDCWQRGFGTTYYMQDYPATEARSITTSAAEPTTTPPSIATATSMTIPTLNSISNSALLGSSVSGPSTPTSADVSKSIPAGAIAGGVVGGLAVISLLIIGVLYIIFRRRSAQAPAPMAGTDNRFNQQPPYSPPATGMDHGFGQYPAPGMHYSSSLPPEMPGVVPDKTEEQSPRTDGASTPVQFQHAVSGFGDGHDVHGGHVDDGREGAGIV